MQQPAVFLLVLTAGLALRAEVADACSCPLADLYPDQDAIGVPIDAELVVSVGWSGASPTLRTAAGSEVAVRVRDEPGPAGSVVKLVRPLEELLPSTAFELVHSERVLRFTTGAERGATPAPADVLELHAAHTDVSACDDATLCWDALEARRVALRYRPATDAAYYELVVTVDGHGQRSLVGRTFLGLSDNSVCSETSDYVPGQKVCAELLAVGPSGARAAAGSIACDTVAACPGDCERLPDCFSPPFDPGPEIFEPPGASGCRAGGVSRDGSGVAVVLALVLGLLRPRLRGTGAAPASSRSSLAIGRPARSSSPTARGRCRPRRAGGP